MYLLKRIVNIGGSSGDHEDGDKHKKRRRRRRGEKSDRAEDVNGDDRLDSVSDDVVVNGNCVQNGVVVKGVAVEERSDDLHGGETSERKNLPGNVEDRLGSDVSDSETSISVLKNNQVQSLLAEERFWADVSDTDSNADHSNAAVSTPTSLEQVDEAIVERLPEGENVSPSDDVPQKIEEIFWSDVTDSDAGEPKGEEVKREDEEPIAEKVCGDVSHSEADRPILSEPVEKFWGDASGTDNSTLDQKLSAVVPEEKFWGDVSDSDVEKIKISESEEKFWGDASDVENVSRADSVPQKTEEEFWGDASDVENVSRADSVPQKTEEKFFGDVTDGDAGNQKPEEEKSEEKFSCDASGTENTGDKKLAVPNQDEKFLGDVSDSDAGEQKQEPEKTEEIFWGNISENSAEQKLDIPKKEERFWGDVSDNDSSSPIEVKPATAETVELFWGDVSEPENVSTAEQDRNTDKTEDEPFDQRSRSDEKVEETFWADISNSEMKNTEAPVVVDKFCSDVSDSDVDEPKTAAPDSEVADEGKTSKTEADPFWGDGSESSESPSKSSGTKEPTVNGHCTEGTDTETEPESPDRKTAKVQSVEDEIKTEHRKSFVNVLKEIEQPAPPAPPPPPPEPVRKRSSVIVNEKREIEHGLMKEAEDEDGDDAFVPNDDYLPAEEYSKSTADLDNGVDHSIMDYLGKETDRAEARLAARRQARVEAREIRMRELERQQKEQEESADKVFNTEPPAVIRTPRTNCVIMSPRDRTVNSRRSSEDSLEDGGLSLRDVRYELKEVDEKFKKAMIANAQLDNEKSSLSYQVELLKDRLEDLEESHAQLTREHKDKCREHEQLRRAVVKLKEDLTCCKYELSERDRMITEYGLVIVGTDEESEDGQPARRALVSVSNVELLNGDRGGSLDVRLKRLAEERNELTDQVRHLKLELEEERSKKKSMLTNGPSMESEEEREASKQLGDYKFRLQKAEQDVSTLQANVARLESQVIRYKSAAESSEKAEDELKIEKRKLQRELRESVARIEELETSNSHLQRRMDKLKNAKSTLLKEL